MTCAECRFWVDLKGNEVGECHRRAPMPAVGAVPGESRGTVWAVTHAQTFCGDFVARVEKRAGFV